MISFSLVLQAVSLRSSKSFSARQFKSLQLLFALVAILGPLAHSPSALGQQTPGRPIAFPTAIQWSKQKAVTTYRLQIADDEKFRNVFYDGRVTGERYTVNGLSPGYYYWRIAPADFKTGGFSKPVRFFVSGGVLIPYMRPGRAGARSKLPAKSTSGVR